MMETTHAPMSSEGQQQEIRESCDAFEAAWKAGQRPRIEEHLKKFPEPQRSKLLRELLVIEFNCRFGPHDTFPMCEFMDRFPEHGAVVRSALAGSVER